MSEEKTNAMAPAIQYRVAMAELEECRQCVEELAEEKKQQRQRIAELEEDKQTILQALDVAAWECSLHGLTQAYAAAGNVLDQFDFDRTAPIKKPASEAEQ